MALPELGEFSRSRISKLSKGMAQKVQILSTLAHRPDFLILDEPFSGLDPVNQQALENLIRAEHDRGATILFSTHVMEHAESLCDRIVMMARGRKVLDGTLKEAFASLGQGARISVEHGFDLAAALSPPRQSSQCTGRAGRRACSHACANTLIDRPVERGCCDGGSTGLT